MAVNFLNSSTHLNKSTLWILVPISLTVAVGRVSSRTVNVAHCPRNSSSNTRAQVSMVRYCYGSWQQLGQFDGDDIVQQVVCSALVVGHAAILWCQRLTASSRPFCKTQTNPPVHSSASFVWTQEHSIMLMLINLDATANHAITYTKWLNYMYYNCTIIFKQSYQLFCHWIYCIRPFPSFGHCK